MNWLETYWEGLKINHLFRLATGAIGALVFGGLSNIWEWAYYPYIGFVMFMVLYGVILIGSGIYNSIKDLTKKK